MIACRFSGEEITTRFFIFWTMLIAHSLDFEIVIIFEGVAQKEVVALLFALDFAIW